MDNQQSRPRVLVVDDDAELLATLADGLEHLGFEVSRAASAREALEMVPGSEERIDALITDIELGDGWGASLALQLRQHQPGMKIIFISGYARQDPILRQGIQEHMTFLEKPFSVRELAKVLNELLGSSPAP